MKQSDLIILSSTRNKTIENFEIKMLDSFCRTTPQECKMLVIENNSNAVDHAQWKEYVESKGQTFMFFDGEFNINKMYNLGTKLTTSEYVMYANSDIVFHTNWYRNLLNWFDVTPNLFVVSPFSKALVPDVNKHGVYRTDVMPVRYIHDTIYIPGWFYCLKRSSHFVWDENFRAHFQDVDFVYTLERMRRKDNSIKSGIAYNSRVDHLCGGTAHNAYQYYYTAQGEYACFAKWGVGKKWN